MAHFSPVDDSLGKGLCRFWSSGERSKAERKTLKRKKEKKRRKKIVRKRKKVKCATLGQIRPRRGAPWSRQVGVFWEAFSIDHVPLVPGGLHTIDARTKRGRNGGSRDKIGTVLANDGSGG